MAGVRRVGVDHCFFLFDLGMRPRLVSRLPVDEHDALGALGCMILIFIGTASANMTGYGHVP